MIVEHLINEVSTQHTGVMVALYLPKEIAQQLAVPGGELPENLHVTLAYLKDVNFDDVVQVVRRVAMDRSEILCGVIGGVGRFNASETSDFKSVLYASFDSPLLASLREYLVQQLEAAKLFPSLRHGFTPHITLKYTDDPSEINSIEAQSGNFNVPALSVVQGDYQRVDCVFGSRPLWPDGGGERAVRVTPAEIIGGVARTPTGPSSAPV